MSLSKKEQKEAQANLFLTKVRCALPRRIDVYGIIYDLWVQKGSFDSYSLCYYTLLPDGKVNYNNKIV